MLELITQPDLDLFKAQYPNNAAIRAPTLDEVQANTQGRTVVWERALDNPPPLILSRMSAASSPRSQKPGQAFRTHTDAIGPWETFAPVQGY